MGYRLCNAPIDWAATGSMIQGLGTAAGVFAVIWGALRATTLWKQQKVAERRLESAERILTASYKIRRAMYEVEMPEGEKSEVSDAAKEAVAIIERICLPALRLEAVNSRMTSSDSPQKVNAVKAA